MGEDEGQAEEEGKRRKWRRKSCFPGGEMVGGGHFGKRKYCINRGMKSQIYMPHVVM